MNKNSILAMSDNILFNVVINELSNPIKIHLLETLQPICQRSFDNIRSFDHSMKVSLSCHLLSLTLFPLSFDTLLVR